MALTSSSPYETYAIKLAFPATGTVDTFYLARTTWENQTEQIPTTGMLWIWDGTQYVYYCAIQDNSFIGAKPAHAPHHN